MACCSQGAARGPEDSGGGEGGATSLSASLSKPGSTLSFLRNSFLTSRGLQTRGLGQVSSVVRFGLQRVCGFILNVGAYRRCRRSGGLRDVGKVREARLVPRGIWFKTPDLEQPAQPALLPFPGGWDLRLHIATPRAQCMFLRKPCRGEYSQEPLFRGSGGCTCFWMPLWYPLCHLEFQSVPGVCISSPARPRLVFCPETRGSLRARCWNPPVRLRSH